MAPKSTPFTVVIHYSNKKSNEEVMNLYVDFYIEQVKKQLIDSNLCDRDKKAILDRLISNYAPTK